MNDAEIALIRERVDKIAERLRLLPATGQLDGIYLMGSDGHRYSFLDVIEGVLWKLDMLSDEFGGAR